MKLNLDNSAKLAMMLVTSMVTAIGTAAGHTVWQTFGKPKLEELSDKQQKPKRVMGFHID